MNSIPKVFHKIWFGPKEETLRYSDKWLDKFPDYELKIWNNDNLGPYFTKMVEYLGELPKCSYNFVSDTLRLLITYDEGGIYLDHDVEIIKNFEHLLAGSKTYLTFQYPICDNPPELLPNTTMRDIITQGGDNGKSNKKLYKNELVYDELINKDDYINACFIATVPKSPIIKTALELYLKNYHSVHKYPMSDWGYGPQVLSHAAEQYGITLNGRTQQNEYVKVFQQDYLHPLHGADRLRNKEEFEIKLKRAYENAFTIHHHVFSNMKAYAESLYKTQDKFLLEAHAFTNWYLNEYKRDKHEL